MLLVELVDFYPTCTELLGLSTPASLKGKWLVPILRDKSATIRDTALSINIRGPGGGLRAANWHYLNYGEAGEELYELVKDPGQYTNVVDNPAYADLLKEARARLQARMAAARQDVRAVYHLQ